MICSSVQLALAPVSNFAVCISLLRLSTPNGVPSLLKGYTDSGCNLFRPFRSIPQRWRMNLDTRLKNVWWMLRLAFGLVPIIAGADKFLNKLTDWEKYLHPAVPRLLHVQPATFMHLVGVIEIVAGLVVLSAFTRWGAYIVTLWLVGIALQLVAQFAYLDVAVRDLMMALAAFTLAKLTEVKQESEVRIDSGVRHRERAIA